MIKSNRAKDKTRRVWRMKRIFLVVLLLVIMFPSVNAEIIGKTNEEVEKIADPIMDNILKEMYAGDYQNFSKDFDDNMKDFLNEGKFRTDTKAIIDEIGEYSSREYLGFLNQDNMTVVLWKGEFKGTENDILIKLVLSKRGNKYCVMGLWFQ